jgi:hypothetical protein
VSQILRPTKTGGSRTYIDEVTAGFDLIRENEIDGDLNTIYGEFNGGIDNDNILVLHTGPKIDYAKLDLTGRLQPSDLAPGFALPSTVYPPGSIPVSALTPNSIGLDQLVNGVCAPARAEHQVGLPDQPQNGSTALNNYLSVAITSVTGTIRVSGHVQGTAVASGSVDIYIIVRFRVGANPARETRRLLHAAGDQFPWTVPFVFYDTIPANTATTVAIDIYQPGPNYTFNTLSCGALVLETWN